MFGYDFANNHTNFRTVCTKNREGHLYLGAVYIHLPAHRHCRYEQFFEKRLYGFQRHGGACKRYRHQDRLFSPEQI